MKKFFICLILFLFFTYSYSSEIENLILLTLNNNLEILEAKKAYNTALLSCKALNGNYAPGFLVSVSSVFENEKKIFKESDQFSSSVSFTKPLPGGCSLAVGGTYSFSGSEVNKERYIIQAPNISIQLSQSLFPFWIQGKINDPAKYSLELQKEYYYNNMLYIQKTVIQNLLQNYANALIYKNESEIYKNSILLIEEQLEAQRQLKETGNTNQSKIIELENNRWNYYQNKLNSISCFENYVQGLKSICGETVDLFMNEKDFSVDIENIPEMKRFQMEDPLEANYKIKIDILKSERIQQKQNSAPVVSLSLQSNWKSELGKQDQWFNEIKKMQNPELWNAGISVNFSPLISASVSKNKSKFELEYEQAINNHKSYVMQKEFVQHQYQNILKEYENQISETVLLLEEAKKELTDYENLYKAGVISKIDYDSVFFRVTNNELALQSLRVNVWLYKTLIEFTN